MLSGCAIALAFTLSSSALAIGESGIVAFTPEAGAFPIVREGKERLFIWIRRIGRAFFARPATCKQTSAKSPVVSLTGF